MNLNYAHQSLLAVQSFPIDRQGGILLQTIYAIEEAEKTNEAMAYLHCDIDRAVMDWFAEAIDINDSDWALLDEDIVNIARYIITSRLAGWVEDCEACDDTVRYARQVVNMADTHGVDNWWLTC